MVLLSILGTILLVLGVLLAAIIFIPYHYLFPGIILPGLSCKAPYPGCSAESNLLILKPAGKTGK
ncbi:MAG: hypothetical protein GX434_04475 [Peptococcaceae bacterium]|nr:hypothetical protein [Peptococcaceae bacterium]